MTDQEERIQKFIANNSSFSRRQAENFIELGSVLVNGTVAKIGQKISPKIDLVTINDQEINADQEEITIAYNKPSAFETNVAFHERRPTQHYATTIPSHSEVSGEMTLPVPWASERTGAAFPSVACRLAPQCVGAATRAG